MPRSLSVWPQNIRFWRGAKSRPMTPKHTHLWNKPDTEPRNHANMTMPRSLSVAFGEVQFRYIQCLRQTSMYLSGVQLMAQRSAETTKAWHCLVHNWWQLLVLSVLPGGFFKSSLSCTLNDWNLNALGGVDAIVISICWNFHYNFHYLLFLTMLAVLV